MEVPRAVRTFIFARWARLSLFLHFDAVLTRFGADFTRFCLARFTQRFFFQLCGPILIEPPSNGLPLLEAPSNGMPGKPLLWCLLHCRFTNA